MIVAGARRARDQGKRLRESDLQRIRPAHVVDAVDAHRVGIALLPSLRPQDHEGSDDEGGRNRHRREESRLDRVGEGEPEHRRGQEGDEQVEHEALRRALAEEPRRDGDQLHAIFPAHREDRARLNHDLEQLRFVSGVAEQRSGDDQMPRRRDREELGETLDNDEDRGDDKLCVGHPQALRLVSAASACLSMSP